MLVVYIFEIKITICDVTELFLDDDDVEKLHDFEEECVDEYMRRKDEDEQKKSDNRIQER